VRFSLRRLHPYGDPWDVEIVGDWTEKIENGREILSLSDTVGNSTLT
jgi:hydroxymethylglutaryl-CoA lyase